MSARLASRRAFQQARWVLQRRTASTTTEAKEAVSSTATKAKDAASSTATKAKEATQEVASKAQSGLSRVTSSAGSVAGSAASAVGNTLSGIGGRTGRLIGFVQSLVPPTVYYAKVVGELGKIIVQGRGMNPPTMQTIQPYLNTLQNAARNPSSVLSSAQQTASSAANTATSIASNAASNPQSYLQRLRSLDSATLTSTAIVGAEAIGFFTVGEMIGRFKLIGYYGDAHPEGHH